MNLYKEAVVALLSGQTTKKNKKEIWWEDADGNKLTVEGINKECYIVRRNGNTCYYKNGQLHRTDGPAVIYASGDQRWYQNGQYHRIDGPAVVFADGAQYWYQNGQRHRTDGPAVIYADGEQRWCLKGIHYTKEEWLIKRNEYH